MLREIMGTLYAYRYRFTHFGRISGGPFILRSPSRIRVHRGGRITLGAGVVIEKGARIVVRNELVIGAGTYIGKNVTIVAYAPVSIGREVLIGENVSVHSEDHGAAGARSDFTIAPVVIENDAWLCAGVVVTKGTRVGARSTVAANGVVARDVPADVLAGGVPVRVLKDLRVATQ